MNRDILGFLLLVLAVVVAVLFFVPKVQEVRSITINKKAKAELAQARDARVQALKQIQTVFAQQPDRIKKLAAVLPSEPQIPEVLVAVEALAKESGVLVSSVVPQVSEQDSAVYLTIVGEGALTSVENLSKLIADNARPMSIPTISLLKSQDGKTISFTLTIKAPYNTPTVALEREDQEEAL